MILWLIHTARERDTGNGTKSNGSQYIYRNVHIGPRQEQELDPLSPIVPAPFPVPIPFPFPCCVNKLLARPFSDEVTEMLNGAPVRRIEKNEFLTL